MYGAGDAKIGKIVGGTRADGKRLKRDFLAKTPALKNLKESIETALVLEMHRGRVKKWRRRYLKGLDGRLLHIRSLHAALNTLLQSAGALICKQWLVYTEEMMVAKGYRHGWDGDFAFMAWVHKSLCLWGVIPIENYVKSGKPRTGNPERRRFIREKRDMSARKTLRISTAA